MAYRSSSAVILSTNTSVALPVPAGVAIGDIVVAIVYIENNPKTITTPTGFIQKYGPDTITAEHHTYWFWKRLTAADSGTYTFSWSVAEPCSAVALAFSGRVTSGDPFDNTAQESALATANFPNLSLTAVGGVDAIVAYSTWQSGTIGASVPAGYTSRENPNEQQVITKDNVSAGLLTANGAVWDGASDLIDRLATLLATPKVIDYTSIPMRKTNVGVWA